MLQNLKFYLILFVLVTQVAENQLNAKSVTYVFENRWNPKRTICAPCELEFSQKSLKSRSAIKMALTGNYNFEFAIEDIVYENIELPGFIEQSLLPQEPQIEVSFGKSRLENFVNVVYNPIIIQNGQVKHISSLKIVVTNSSIITSNRTTTFAPTSVLSSGLWYKVGVTKSGIHKIDYTFLSNLGVSVSSLNPSHINIYGNHVPELPVLNSEYHPDDLVKNSILVVGEGDGSFDASDYILFYATGPDEVVENSTSFDVSKNDIDSLAYYFIHIDAGDSPKRISGITNSISAATHNVTTSNDYFLHENDDINLIKSGDGWFGEHFDIELTHSFTANLEGYASGSDIVMNSGLASNMKSGSASLSINVNGIQQDLLSCPTLSGSYTEAKYQSSSAIFSSSTANLNFELNFTRSSASTEAWLNFILLNYQRNLTVSSNQFIIRNFNSVGIGNVTNYTISNANSSVQIWEVTDPTNANSVSGSLAGSTLTFKQNSDSLRSFVCFTQSQAFIPTPIGSINNQNLHGLSQADYIIVTHSSLMTQAERLAGLHESNGLTVHVLDIQHVYNEFSGGSSDPVAVRWLMKMFYDRAAGDPTLSPKYLCLFGDGTYDPLNRLDDNDYLVPTYNSKETGDVDFISSYTSDDFFGMLDDNEGIFASNLLDIGIGRITASTLDEAEKIVNKIEHYMKFGSYLYSNTSGIQCDSDGYSSTFGDWRNRIVLMADDEDYGQFVNDCESLSDSVANEHPEMNVVKIYLDSYQQTVTSGGERYPEVEEAINQNINRGALIFNYVGHGGETGLSLERVVTIPMIENWTNINNLTIFISATCEFSRFDDPERISAGEITLTTPYGGAVSLLTTTRLVQVTVNTILVQNLYSVMFDEVNGEPLALGEILRQTKNLSAGSDNIRNFTLLGDPALQLGKAQPMIVTDSINGVSISSAVDTLKSLSKITVSGHVEDFNGVLMSTYNGVVFPTVFDKIKTKYTLGQDPNSPVKDFTTQNNIIYKGKATVTNGYFNFSFVVPKDIDYNFGKGKISYYSQNGNSNSYGFDTARIVGGVNPNGLNDVVGPTIELFMNDENFVNGGTTNSRPNLIAKISDENGINTTGNGIGHDITLILDGNTASPIVLNNFYEADLDTYQSGQVNYQFSELEPGQHQLKFKVWDVNNNSSEATLDFVVVEESELGLTHVLNYPNPFTTHTEFYFEHNQCCSNLEVKIEVFTVSGKLVKTIFDQVNTIAFRSEGIAWDGRDDYGDKLARGVYVYRLSVKTPEGLKAEKIEKLVIL